MTPNECLTKVSSHHSRWCECEMELFENIFRNFIFENIEARFQSCIGLGRYIRYHLHCYKFCVINTICIEWNNMTTLKSIYDALLKIYILKKFLDCCWNILFRNFMMMLDLVGVEKSSPLFLQQRKENYFKKLKYMSTVCSMNGARGLLKFAVFEI